MKVTSVLRNVFLSSLLLLCGGALHAQDEPSRAERPQAAAAAPAGSAAATPEGSPVLTQNAEGTQGMVVLDGDSSFFASSVVMRPKPNAPPYIAAQPAAGGAFVVAAAPGQERFVVHHGGNVGIGVLGPSARLQINGGTTIPLRIYGSTGFGATFRDVENPLGHGLVLEMAGNSTIDVSNLQIGDNGNPRLSSKAGDLLLAAGGGAGVVVGSPQVPTKLTVMGPTVLTAGANTGGDVVIGTSGSAAKLLVNGNGTSEFTGSVIIRGGLTVTGDISGYRVLNAVYRDVAEWVDSDQKLSDGTVVIVAPDKADRVIASNTAYDTRVAGVVSPEPGVLLGVPAEGRVKVATTGRVKVRVDASVHPIAMGDLLVSSAKPGVAMKSIPLDLGGVAIHRPGTLIGKALEPLSGGEGEILVLLSLQ